MSMAKDDKVILTPDQAIDLLPTGKHVHNFANPGVGMMIGCDYDRPDAEKALREAKQIELGGPQCMAMKHPIVCWHTDKRLTFFAADMDKVRAFESALT
jgi:hypothetical protein